MGLSENRAPQNSMVDSHIIILSIKVAIWVYTPFSGTPKCSNCSTEAIEKQNWETEKLLGPTKLRDLSMKFCVVPVEIVAGFQTEPLAKLCWSQLNGLVQSPKKTAKSSYKQPLQDPSTVHCRYSRSLDRFRLSSSRGLGDNFIQTGVQTLQHTLHSPVLQQSGRRGYMELINLLQS